MTPPAAILSPTRRLIASGFLMDLYVAMVSLGIQNLGVYVLHAPPMILGLFGTFSAMAYAFGCLLSGGISDRFGRRRCIVASCIGAACVWVLLPGLGHWRYVLMLIPFSGASLSLFWPSVQAWLAELSSGRLELSRNLALFNILWCAGLMVGPVITGYLWKPAQSLVFFIPAVGMSLIAIIALTTPRGKAAVEVNGDNERADHEDGDLFLKLAWIGNFTSWFGGAIIGAMFPKLAHSLGFGPELVGWLLFAYRGGQVALFVYSRYEHRWQYRLWPMVAAELLACGGMLLVAGGAHPGVFAVGFILAGLCGGMTYVGSLFYSLHGRSQGKGKTSGIHEAVLGSGAWLGPLLGGLSAQYVSLRAPFVVGAAAFAVAMAVQLALLARHRGRLRRAEGETAEPALPERSETPV